MIFDDKHVKIHGAFIVWDGITRPEQGHDGKPKYSLKVVVNPNNPDLADMNNLANTTLQTSKFRGQLPAGGRMPIGQARADEFNNMYPGWVVLGCNTQRLPDVYDENGQKLDPMQYGPMLFGAQQVDVLVHCYEYDAKGNKGIATGLDAFSIIASANAVPQNFGGAGIATQGAFGPGSNTQNNNGGNQNNQQNGQQDYSQNNNGGNQNNQQNGQQDYSQNNNGGNQNNNGGNQNNNGQNNNQQNGGNQNNNGQNNNQQNGGNQNNNGQNNNGQNNNGQNNNQQNGQQDYGQDNNGGNQNNNGQDNNQQNGQQDYRQNNNGGNQNNNGGNQNNNGQNNNQPTQAQDFLPQ